MIARTQPPTPDIDPISVDRLTSYIEQALLQTPELRQVWVCGEVSSATHHPSGIYFNLKDKVGRASIPAVIWKSQIPELATKPQIGIEVLAFGKIAIYAPHGKYQFQVQQGSSIRARNSPNRATSSKTQTRDRRKIANRSTRTAAIDRAIKSQQNLAIS